MMPDYFARLACLSLAAFFAVHLASGIGVVLIASPVAQLAARLRPRIAARILLALRFVPLALALFTVAALCVPSYLWLEPDEATEQVGPAGRLAAVLATTLFALALARAVRLVRRSRRWAAGNFDGDAPVLATAGIFKPEIVVSPSVRDHLTAEEMTVALRHEEAHRDSFDNLKRLLIALAPGLLPGWHGFGPLEAHWHRFAEWAADDEAVQGDNTCSLALASALVRMARISGTPVPLADRVNRLLHPDRIQPWEAQPTAIIGAAAMTVIGSAAAVAMNPSNLESAHRLLERLIR